MQYLEYQPNTLLSPYIETYWTGNDFAGKEVFYKILPNGCVDIIFTLDKTNDVFYADIIGATTSYLENSQPQTVQMFGIRFKPAGITAFTRVPIEELTNRRIDLALVETLFDKSFYEFLPEKQSLAEMITHFDNYLITRLSSLYYTDKQIIRAVEFINFTKGQLSPSKVAYEVCLCPRHFERKFKLAIGVSPKSYSKLIRFKHALRYLRSQPHEDLLSVAIRCGYYDHTHLIKDFKTFSGNTPTDLRQ
jgi:AraC-like DNA-binding protein